MEVAIMKKSHMYMIIGLVVLCIFCGAYASLHSYVEKEKEEAVDAYQAKIERQMEHEAMNMAKWSDIDGDGMTSITYTTSGGRFTGNGTGNLTVSGSVEEVGALLWCYDWLIR
jgi:hypothetical protein